MKSCQVSQFVPPSPKRGSAGNFFNMLMQSQVLIGVCVLCVLLITPAMANAQTGTAPSSTSGLSSESNPSELEDLETRPPSIFEMMFTGNSLGVVIVGIIILLSMVSTFFIIEHALSITRAKLIPNKTLTELERLISRGEINEAIQICHQKENYSLSTDVILAGLERYNASEFGFAEYRTAVEEAGEDHTGRLYRKTEILNVIAAIAPMLGLTGTVIGMIEAFNTIAIREGAARPGELAGGIGQALITTLLGLLVAIPTMVAVSYFRNKIDSIVAEAGKRVERILLPLGRKR
ncbi:MAG TPA: MotA/TolQ/ExbB proton channel family protein [Pirellulaceae bacterium]|nr:MotA/TolQ/ExbB proton channel family protein [Pirellulaceae bacterium]HMO91670.1 MotA/TolQ/ExbB proton channel family protein [Pirellulaceae bacterium]HMP68367.1 MotA/TolQ/ExbB proton channel family protein [Pirellulaceae bacterium]